jgi:dihydroorotase
MEGGKRSEVGEVQVRIKSGRVIDPGNFDALMDVFIQDGKIDKIVPPDHLDPESRHETSEYQEIDATGKIVTPGLIDMHVHLREPGHEYKETIATGSMAAAHGGFTAVCAMPNTNPVNDNRQVTEYILQQAAKTDSIRVYPVASISKGLQGCDLSDYKDLKKAGAIALSDDGNPVMNSHVMRKALEHAREFNLLIISHCEDINLVANGVMNEGAVATRMGLAGIPNVAESIMVERDISLCDLTCTPLHIAHVSTLESVRAVREAKKRGVPITAETAPHYFTLTDEDVEKYISNAKMNPPLRSSKDRAALLEGLADGTIDVIATDHAPHSNAEKEVEFDHAANGIIGLETSLSLCLKLVDHGVLSFAGLIEKMSKNPARILGLENGLMVGRPADITIIDPDITHRIDATAFQSLSRNTPFDGWNLKGKAILTMVGGEVIYREE